TNIGNFNSDRFSVVPELNARFSYQFAPGWRALVGYNFIYWTGVVRPGGVIDTAVNPTQLPPGPLTGAARPAPRADTTDYWMHGVSVGARYEF
ncbi:MAG: BBP7 family outer membrane beta-barrel protein, partial [Xanthobacteraceae bacterium]